MNRVLPRKKRCTLIRRKIAERADRMRLTVNKSSKHIYAQVFSADGSKVLVSASTVEKDIRSKDFGTGRIKRSEAIGRLVAERAKAKGISQVAFDRSGYKYHGRIKALADGAREAGLEF